VKLHLKTSPETTRRNSSISIFTSSFACERQGLSVNMNEVSRVKFTLAWTKISSIVLVGSRRQSGSYFFLIYVLIIQAYLSPRTRLPFYHKCRVLLFE
jgi:hypothetical protein